MKVEHHTCVIVRYMVLENSPSETIDLTLKKEVLVDSARNVSY